MKSKVILIKLSGPLGGGHAPAYCYVPTFKNWGAAFSSNYKQTLSRRHRKV